MSPPRVPERDRDRDGHLTRRVVLAHDRIRLVEEDTYLGRNLGQPSRGRPDSDPQNCSGQRGLTSLLSARPVEITVMAENKVASTDVVRINSEEVN